jgi:hypothetical protein
MEASGQLQAPAALPPGEEPLVHLGQEAGWAPIRSGRGGEFPAPFGNRNLEPQSSSP